MKPIFENTSFREKTTRFSVFSGRRGCMQTLNETAPRRRIEQDSHPVRADEDPA